MSKVPFKRFIIAFLFLNKSIPSIIDSLKSFKYYITEQEALEILNELRENLSPDMLDTINNNIPLDLNNEVHIQCLKQFGVFEFCDYVVRKDSIKKNFPTYFQWCETCFWIHKYPDVMSLINLLLFNKEDLDEIIKIIAFKEKKYICKNALTLHQNLFWDVECLTAKEALYHCVPLRDSVLIIKKLKSGLSEVGQFDTDLSDGCEVPVTFHSTNYIKWKIGYPNVVVPNAKEFMEKVKTDSYYKYYEATNMERSNEGAEDDGVNDKFGAYNSKEVKKRNVEEQRALLMKHWMELYLQANEAVPEAKTSDIDFFERMQQMDLDFQEGEKIVSIKDFPNILNDIKSDISS